jgi:transposase
MPWRESSVMEERLCFVARLLDGETMTDVCREFGISRKTGYKIFDRYKEHRARSPERPLAAAGALDCFPGRCAKRASSIASSA